MSNGILSIEDLINSKLEYKEAVEAGTVVPQKTRFTMGVIPPGAMCGTCGSISYTGINEVTLKWGTCEDYKQSGMLAVNCMTPHCHLWHKRSANKIIAEREFARKMTDVILKLNASLKGGSRNIDKMEMPKRPKELSEKPKKNAAELLSDLMSDTGDDDE